jgi:hypothetical protein
MLEFGSLTEFDDPKLEYRRLWCRDSCEGADVRTLRSVTSTATRCSRAHFNVPLDNEGTEGIDDHSPDAGDDRGPLDGRDPVTLADDARLSRQAV